MVYWNFIFKRNISSLLTKFNSNLIDISKEVQSALKEKKAVVALESTIITHGMPHPQNYETAHSVEQIIREQDCIPAHIAIYEGRIKVGLNKLELQKISDPSTKAIKTSRRDIPYVISNGLFGGTTVCGTLIVARTVGINIFVTGGIGGVHRHGENTLDISADLRELGRHPIMVVSSGVKSILDIQLTLEYLETEGVCVVGYGTSDFPAFYTTVSGFKAPYHVNSPLEAAKLLKTMNDLQINSGLLLGVPVPPKFSIDTDVMNTTIQLALEEAEKFGIIGKEITPFVLRKVSTLTKGKSLDTNMALIKNNARVGAQIAKKYEMLERSVQQASAINLNVGKKPIVIGGSVLDCVMSVDVDLKMDGRTLPGKISQSPGGVGRNLADAIGKVHRIPPLFLSAVGSDEFGTYLLKSLNHVDSSGVNVKENLSTACYSVIVDNNGEAKVGIGDMRIHSTISPEQISKHESMILNSPIIVMDGNIDENTINHLLNLSNENKIPTWFEPTDILKATKPFNTDLWKSITCISPNINELMSMAKAIGVNVEDNLVETRDFNNLLERLIYLASPLSKFIPLIMVTLGRKGLLVISRIKPDEQVAKNFYKPNDEIFIRHYPAKPSIDIVNAVGAGDSSAAAFISGILQGLTEPECVQLGMEASYQSLKSSMAIPERLHLDTSIIGAQFTEISF